MNIFMDIKDHTDLKLLSLSGPAGAQIFCRPCQRFPAILTRTLLLIPVV
jgi:hypothetical protein